MIAILGLASLAVSFGVQHALIMQHRGDKDTDLPSSDPCQVSELTNAYNSHDARGFASMFGMNVELFMFPAKTAFETGRRALERSMEEEFSQYPQASMRIHQWGKKHDFCFYDMTFDMGNGEMMRTVEVMQMGDIGLMNRNWIMAEEDSDVKLDKPACDYAAHDLMEAYNAGDAQAFADMFSEDVQDFQFPQKLSLRGRKAIEHFMTGMMAVEPGFRASQGMLASMGNYCMDQVHISDRSGQRMRDVVMVQKICSGEKICSVWFL